MDAAKEKTLKSYIREILDYPIKGILFYDITTALKNPEALKIIASELKATYEGLGVTKVVGIESRGFIGGAILANELGAGIALIRKPGKLPADTIKKSYAKEYGTDTIEIHSDAIDENDIVVLHDDLLATGGTMAAAYELVMSMKPKKVYISFIIELADLNGRDLFPEDVEVSTLLTY